MPTAKRVFDLILTIPTLIVLSPFFVILIVLTAVLLGAPVLFRQVRPGLGGKPFTIYKLRTMSDVSDAHGNPLPDEKRLTRISKFLRATSLDEFSEL